MSKHDIIIGIVGGSGFIGSFLARHFSKTCKVKVLDITAPRFDLDDSARYEYCDVRNYDNVHSALSDVDVVLHTAIIQIPQINENKRVAYEVNVLGTQNVCEAVRSLSHAKGMILAGSWHTIGERELSGTVNEEFGFRPDKVEDRARLYSLSKMAQEAIVRFYDEMSEKVYGVIRTGTALGEGMPENTAARIFIERAARGESITPYKHSMYRPMLYVDVDDVCRAYDSFVNKILNDEIDKSGNSLARIVNIYYPEPISILDLAEIVRDCVTTHTQGKVKPHIEIVDKHLPPLFSKQDKERIKVDIGKAERLLGIDSFLSPKESVEKLVRSRHL